VVAPALSLDNVFRECEARGLVLVPKGDRLRVCPASAVPRHLLDAIRAHKSNLLRRLADGPAPVESAPDFWAALRGLLPKCGCSPLFYRPAGATHWACLYCEPPLSDDEVADAVNTEKRWRLNL
jgi:hypothetical protein